jgi:aminopeptidase N
MVEVDFFDGMEYQGLFFLSGSYFADYAGDPRSYLVALSAHETSHQWWYGLVGNNQATEPWLDEAFATYSELLFFQARYPYLEAWWWDFRVARFEPAGWLDSSIYDHEDFRSYVDAVYLRGALFLHQVRGLIGDEAFMALLRDYVEGGAYDQATGEDFFYLLEKHDSADMKLLMQEYYERQNQ